MKLLPLVVTLAVSLTANFAMGMSLVAIHLTEPPVQKASLVPTIQISPTMPPIHMAVPLPKPKPVVHAKKRSQKHVKHVKSPLRAHSKHHAVHKRIASGGQKRIVVAGDKEIKFSCSQLPSWITKVSPATIRSEGSARGYSQTVLDKVIACREKMGGTRDG
jgi:hypothetical protein